MTRINIADGKRTPLQAITQDKAGLSDFHVEISADRKSRAAGQGGKVKSLSLHHRFVIALYSPGQILEAGPVFML